MRFSFIIILFLSFFTIKSQNNRGKFDLEITKAKIGINAGPYRGRTSQTDGFFNQGIAGFGQIYFPFQWTIDYRSNLSNSVTITNEYNDRIFLARPSALFHIVDNGSIAFGLAIQFSFLIFNHFYIEYQLAEIYLEAPKSAAPDLNSGFNLHHFVSISKPINRHFSLSLGFIHMSGAGLGNGKVSNQDVITLGIKWNI